MTEVVIDIKRWGNNLGVRFPAAVVRAAQETGLPFGWHVRSLAERGLQFVSASRPGYGDSTRQAGRSVAL